MKQKAQCREDYLEDFIKTEKESGNTRPLSPNYYHQHGIYSQVSYLKEFGSWKQFKKEAYEYAGRDLEREKIENDQVLLKSELEALRNKLKSNQKTSALNERILEEYRQQLTNGSIKLPVISNKILPKKPLKAILNLSDWHCGEVIKPETVNNLNEYNPRIMVQRGDHIFNQFVTHCNNFHISDVIILLNGDLIHGDIHAEFSRTNEGNVIQNLLFLQSYLLKKIEFLSEHLNRIELVCLVGNHARVEKGKPYFQDKVVLNWEYLLYQQLKLTIEATKNKKVIVTVPESPFAIVEINKHNILCTHGDLFGGGGGGFAGLPLYGLAMSSAKFYGVLSQVGVDQTHTFDSVMIGHYHNSSKIKIFTGGNLFLNGCLVGTDTFSLGKMKNVASCSQTMLMIDEKGKAFLDIELFGK